MPPRRRRSTLEQRQCDLSRPPVSSFCDLLMDEQRGLEPSSLVLGEEEEEMPFLQDDWWTSSSSAAGIDQPHESFDSVVDPFLHYPDESQTTLTGICFGPAAAAAAAVATPKSATRRKSALGINANGKPNSSRESHILSERQRRKGMNHLFATLAALLPENTPKGDKSTIVSQIILYIQSLQGELQELSKKQVKREEAGIGTAPQSCRSPNTLKHSTMDSSLAPNVVFSVCGPDAFVTMSADTGHSLLARALTTLKQHRLEVVDGNISSSGSKMFYYFHAKVLNGLEVPRDPLQTALQRLAMETVTSSPSATET